MNLGDETQGQRIARLRKGKGFTQTQLAVKIGILQNIISAYERDRLGLQSEMAIRIAQTLQVSTDELLGIKASLNPEKLNLKLVRRLKKIAELPAPRQKMILQTIDVFLRDAERDSPV